MTEIGKRVCNTKAYPKAFQNSDPNFNPDEEIFKYSVLKDYSAEPSLREVGEKGWLDKLQPLRTDMESDGRGYEQMLDTVAFVDVEIESD